MLLGREQERLALDRVMAGARLGSSAVLALVGEAGIGKTSLLEYAAENAAGLQLLRARGVESETNIPFAGLFDLLTPALGLLSRIPSARAATLESALALRPGIAGERFAVGAATLSLLAAYADEAPVLMLIDDAHLLDASTAEALRFALRRLVAERLGAILALREGETSLVDDADLPVLHVGGLDERAASQLLGAVAPDTAARLYRATAGNPLALIELSRESSRLAVAAIDAPIAVPAKVSRAFVRRAEQLDDSVRQLLVLVATNDADDLATLTRAAASMGLDLRGLTTPEDAGLISLGAGQVQFRHPLARAAIYAEALPEQRRAAHLAVARALPDRDADRRAWHLAAATIGTDGAVSSALAQAGTRARERSAYGVADAAFERAARLAVDDARRGQLLALAADAAWLAGFADRAIALLSEARELVIEPERLIEIEQLRGHIAVHRGPVMEGHAILVAAAERVASTEPELAVSLLAEAVDACFYAGEVAAMVRTAERAESLLPEHASNRTRFLAATANGMALVFAGDPRGGIDSFRSAVVLAEDDKRLREEPRLLSLVVMGPLWIRETGSGRDLVEEAIETARAQAALGVLPGLLTRVARDHVGGDDWATGAVEYDEAIRLGRESGQRTELAGALAGLAWLEARQGRESECRAHAEEASALCDALGIGLLGTWAVRALGELELGLGRPAAAIDHFLECERRLAGLGIMDIDISPAAELIDAYLRVGRPAEAVAISERLERESRKKGQPWSLARSARSRGLLAPDGQYSELFEQALALQSRTPDTFELGLTHFAHGARLRRGRRRRDARLELRAALDIFDRLGAAPWSEQTRTELLATGETPRRRDVAALDMLTRQEFHIAQVLAGGKTTREAAAALFLSPKTVEYHLRNVYSKLGVNSRSELAAMLKNF
jgi:DNA-binding CsgD family transcriptional regulator